jgi:hypothetical protein
MNFSSFNPDSTVHDPILDGEMLIESIKLLPVRIFERFPQSGLYRLSRQLVEINQTARERAEWVARPIYILRISSIAIIFLLIGSLIWSIINISFPEETPDILEFIFDNGSRIK